MIEQPMRDTVPTVLNGADQVRDAVGRSLGTSPWLQVDQERVDQFADATGDHQWIHVSPERAAAESPWGGTIAHGYLTLALVNAFLPQVVSVEGFSMGVNYGLNKVRFPAAVPVGSRLRAHVELTSADEVPGGVQTTMTVQVECDGADRPACIAEVISRYVE